MDRDIYSNVFFFHNFVSCRLLGRLDGPAHILASYLSRRQTTSTLGFTSHTLYTKLIIVCLFVCALVVLKTFTTFIKNASLLSWRKV